MFSLPTAAHLQPGPTRVLSVHLQRERSQNANPHWTQEPPAALRLPLCDPRVQSRSLHDWLGTAPSTQPFLHGVSDSTDWKTSTAVDEVCTSENSRTRENWPGPGFLSLNPLLLPPHRPGNLGRSR